MIDLQAMRKVTGSLSKSQCTVVFLNQLRSKIGVIYGSPDVTSGELLGCLRFTKFCWVGKHVNIILKPTNSPQPKANPTQEKNGLKVAFGPRFPTANIFSWVGVGFI